MRDTSQRDQLAYFMPSQNDDIHSWKQCPLGTHGSPNRSQLRSDNYRSRFQTYHEELLTDGTAVSLALSTAGPPNKVAN